MGVRTVRLDQEGERLLADITKRTGLTASDALRAGLAALEDALQRDAAAHPFAIYEALDLGPGGDALAPSGRAKQAVREIIGRRKLAR